MSTFDEVSNFALNSDDLRNYHMDVLKGTKREPTLPLKEELAFFAPHTEIFGIELKDISFKKDLRFFDTSGFKTDEKGLEELNTKLQTVETIDFLRITLFAGPTDKIANFIATAFPQSVWKSLKVLDIGKGLTFYIKNFGELLKENKSMEALILHDDVSSEKEHLLMTLPIFPSLKILNLGYPRGGCEPLFAFVKKNYENVETYLLDRKFQAKDFDFQHFRSLPMGERVKTFENSLSTDLLDCNVATLPTIRHITDPLPYNNASKMDSQFDKQREYYCFKRFLQQDSRKKALSTIKVAVLDTGVDYFHPDLNKAIAGGKSFVPNEHWFTDVNGHGTHCAGIIAGNRSGVAPDVKLYVGKVVDSKGEALPSWLSEGIEWAITSEVDIISMSLGYREYHHNVWEKVEEALFKGIVVVCAAGNDGSMYQYGINFPATIGGVIRVGSVNGYGRSSDFSSVGGPQVDAAALGETVLSTWPCDNGQVRYRCLDGTSMATPFVAAVCALLLAYDRGETHNKLHNAHCMKDILGRLCFNNTQEVAKGRGTLELKRIFDLPQLFKYELDHIR